MFFYGIGVGIPLYPDRRGVTRCDSDAYQAAYDPFTPPDSHSRYSSPVSSLVKSFVEHLSLTLSPLHIDIYVCIFFSVDDILLHTCLSLYLYLISFFLTLPFSLSLSLYIYIYIYILLRVCCIILSFYSSTGDYVINNIDNAYLFSTSSSSELSYRSSELSYRSSELSYRSSTCRSIIVKSNVIRIRFFYCS